MELVFTTIKQDLEVAKKAVAEDKLQSLPWWMMKPDIGSLKK
jgi:hypothetical protein